MRLIVDRIVENLAVLEKEDLTHIDVSLSVLPDGTKEGSILEFSNGEYILLENEEKARREEILKKQRNIFKKK